MRDAFFEKLVEAARTDERIIVLSADHGAFALKKFEEEMPSRYINMGIAEQNMVGVAAGLAASGKIVFIYGITPFVSLRVLEQLTIDVAALQLPVNVISVGTGFTYSTDGPTHQGLQDVAAIATIPGMTILNSSDPENTKAFVKLAIENKKPHYIRIEKEKLSTLPRKENIQEVVGLGYSKFIRLDSTLVIITSGIFTQSALKLADSLILDFGINVSIIDVHQLKPFPDLTTILNEYKSVIVFEESYRSLIGYEIAKLIADKSIKAQLKILDAGENYYFQGSDRNSMLEMAEISPNYFAKFVSQFTETKLGN